MNLSILVPVLGAFAAFGLTGPALACAMGGVPSHNIAHDGTPTCVTCTCAHHEAEPPDPDRVTEAAPDHGHTHDAPAGLESEAVLARLMRMQRAPGAILAACRTYKVICGQTCVNRRVKNGGVWITVPDCKPRYCDHTTCN